MEGRAQGGEPARLRLEAEVGSAPLMLLWVQAEKSVPGCVHAQFLMDHGVMREDLGGLFISAVPISGSPSRWLRRAPSPVPCLSIRAPLRVKAGSAPEVEG